MEILHLSTGDSRGAFYGAYRTHVNLRKYGHESTMFVLEKTSDNKNVVGLQRTRTKILNLCFKILRRLIISRDKNEDKTYLIYNTTFNVGEIISKYNKKPDLIIIYYIAGFLSDADVLKIQQHYKCRVAFYLMDAAMFTGGCHYPWHCEGYKTGCKQCPAMILPHIIKLPAHTFNNRKKYFNEMDCFFLSASKWLDERCLASGIKAKLGMKKAIIGIDENTFTPRHVDIAREKINVDIPAGHRVIFLGAQSLGDPRKGVKYVIDALEIIKRENPQSLENISFLTVGAQPQTVLPQGISVINIGFIHDKEKYPYLYNLADGFICSSIEDAGPMMINEALMSGVPVIAFKVGVAEDLIVDQINGFLAEKISADAMASVMLKFLQLDESSLLKLKDSSRQSALENCSSHVQVKAIESLVLGDS